MTRQYIEKNWDDLLEEIDEEKKEYFEQINKDDQYDFLYSYFQFKNTGKEKFDVSTAEYYFSPKNIDLFFRKFIAYIENDITETKKTINENESSLSSIRIIIEKTYNNFVGESGKYLTIAEMLHLSEQYFFAGLSEDNAALEKMRKYSRKDAELREILAENKRKLADSQRGYGLIKNIRGRAKELISAMFRNDPIYFSVIFSEDENNENIILTAIFAARYMGNLDQQILDEIIQSFDLSSLDEKTLAFVFRNISYTDLDFMKKYHGKYVFEYIENERLEEIQETNESLKKLRDKLVSDLECREEHDPITFERFDEANARDLLDIYVLNGNCYFRKNLLKWFETSTIDPMLNIEVDPAIIKSI
jgi:hypothetical protein